MENKIRHVKKVCVLFGGISPEHDISVKSALFALKSLTMAGFECRAYYLDRQNRPGGPDSAARRVDVLIEKGMLSAGEYTDTLE